MKFNLIPLKEITDLIKELNIELVINERAEREANYTGYKYYVSFADSEVKDGNFLSGTFGDGNTFDEALIDYCKEISEQTLVLNAFSQIELPKITHTKLLNK